MTPQITILTIFFVQMGSTCIRHYEKYETWPKRIAASIASGFYFGMMIALLGWGGFWK